MSAITPYDPWIGVDPGIQGGQPTLAHSRLPLSCIAEPWWTGWTLGELLANYPQCGRSGLIVACWYYGRYGTATWRKRYGAWAKEHGGAMWSSKWDDVPLPPQKAGTQ